MSDWRLNGQERYLYGVKLKHMNIKDKSNPSDHEHCEFCLEKISNYSDTIHEAYCTEDEYYWYPPTNPPDKQKRSRTKNIRLQTTTGYYEQL